MLIQEAYLAEFSAGLLWPMVVSSTLRTGVGVWVVGGKGQASIGSPVHSGSSYTCK